MGWTSLKSYVQTELAYEGNTITDDLLSDYANQAVDIISEVVRPLPISITLSSLQRDGEAYLLPRTLVGPLVVTCEGFVVPTVPLEDYQRMAETGGPIVCHVSGLRFFTTSTSPESVNIHGAQALPHYVVGEDDPDPMKALPLRFDKLPAHYVLANYRAGADVPSEVARVQRHMTLWQDGLAAAHAAVRGLGAQEYRF